MRRHSDVVRAQRAIVLQVLSRKHQGPWTRAELQDAISDIPPGTVARALSLLSADGIVICDGEQVHGSRCTWRLEALELISV
jgi:DNA-binding HxlR family transcriptional regulator